MQTNGEALDARTRALLLQCLDVQELLGLALKLAAVNRQLVLQRLAGLATQQRTVAALLHLMLSHHRGVIVPHLPRVHTRERERERDVRWSGQK